MQADSAVQNMLRQLGYQSPTLIVLVVAAIVAFMYLGRAPLPSLLTLAGVAVLVLTTFGFAGLQTLLMQNRTPSLGSQMQALAIASGCLRAVGTALLVGAIFVGRNERTSRYLEEEDE
jgi:hypothetical protein